jgi:hypothetical protein
MIIEFLLVSGNPFAVENGWRSNFFWIVSCRSLPRITC